MSFPFDPTQGMVVVMATLFGPQGKRKVRLGLDTGATETVISRHILANIGVDILAAPTVRVVMGGGPVSIPRVTLDKLEALGQTQIGLAIHAHTLPPSLPIDGLLGLDFLRGYRLTLDFREGKIALK